MSRSIKNGNPENKGRKGWWPLLIFVLLIVAVATIATGVWVSWQDSSTSTEIRNLNETRQVLQASGLINPVGVTNAQPEPGAQQTSPNDNPTATATPTATPTSTLTPPQTPAGCDTLAREGANGEAGFDVWVAGPTELVADGVSTTQINIVTHCELFVGQRVTLGASGGGTLSQIEASLPALDAALTLSYMAGRSTSDIRLTGFVVLDGVRYSDTATLRAVTEPLTLTLDHQAATGYGNDIAVQVIPKLLSGYQMASGDYTLQLRSDGGQWIIDNPNVAVSGNSVEFTSAQIQNLQAATPLYLLTSAPNAENPVRLQLSIIERRDVPALPYTLVPAVIETQNEIRGLGAQATTDIPERRFRMLNDIDTELQMCLRAYRNGVLINAPSATFTYEPLLAPDPNAAKFAPSETLWQPGEPLRDGALSRYGTELFYGLPDRCLRLVKSIVPSGGLLEISAYATRPAIADRGLAIVFFSRVQLNQSQSQHSVDLATADGTGFVSLPLPRVAADVFYLTRPPAGQRRGVLVPLWVPEQYLDALNGTVTFSQPTAPFASAPRLLVTDPLSEIAWSGNGTLANTYIVQDPQTGERLPSVIAENGTSYVRVYVMGTLQ